MKYIAIFFSIFLLSANIVVTDVPITVFEKAGNIFYSKSDKDIQLTKTGFDRSPVLSPDGSLIAFIRKSSKEAYLSVGAPEDYSNKKDLLGDQIWIIDLKTKKERLVCKDRIPEETGTKDITNQLRRTIAHIDSSSLQFSPDNKKIYFISSAWTTSGAVHSVNIDGSNEKFITDGNSLQVIYKGKYKGDLIINKHKYFLTGGTYDWWWVVTPEGEEIAPLGDDLDYVDWESLYFEEDIRVRPPLSKLTE